jgi:hypothetical protein
MEDVIPALSLPAHQASVDPTASRRRYPLLPSPLPLRAITSSQRMAGSPDGAHEGARGVQGASPSTWGIPGLLLRDHPGVVAANSVWTG